MAETYEQTWFFDNGVHFSCQRCGHCCTGAPGTVAVSEQEVEAIALFLGMRIDTFTARFLKADANQLTIGELPDGRCQFFEDGCRIYAVRPRQCRTFPFWLKNLRSAGRWQAAANDCPGIGSGEVWSCETILSIVDMDIR